MGGASSEYFFLLFALTVIILCMAIKASYGAQECTWIVCDENSFVYSLSIPNYNPCENYKGTLEDMIKMLKKSIKDNKTMKYDCKPIDVNEVKK